MFNAVIIDDEKDARELVKFLVTSYFQEIQIIDTASSVVEGIKSIAKHKPKIVFLDIEMQDGNGFDVLDGISDKNFEFIFITAFDHYAVKAFKYSAIDYLVKPIDVDEFTDSVNRIINKLNLKKDNQKHYTVLKENFQTKTLSKLALPSNKGYEFVKVSDIIRFEADGRYTNVYLKNNRMITVTKLLKEFIDLIDDHNFYRTHKSHLINLNYVKMFVKTEGGSILMTDGSNIPISKTNRDEFLDIMFRFNAKKI